MIFSLKLRTIEFFLVEKLKRKISDYA
ncbi:hypothetical protein BWQ96_04696 [Gracilariopsis chorda]|uniref:Uncharacterized protein n=1 Tax=Gracilariopsis chorda TaxID=448386 RepID=A0A2V3ITU9_9FLOR|nr:hypothetical protein BWQ96_04696 [Gracilariopsis chorda]|eukprot:PXF45558.1 hypothetical protein BWQ96_04696 [Gracilariopsis chorda]